MSRKLFGCSFEMTVSPSSGATLSWISTPSVPGRMKVASSSSQMWRTWKTGSPAARKFARSRAADAAAASGPSSGWAPPGK